MSKKTNDARRINEARRLAEARNAEDYLNALSRKYKYEYAEACRHLKKCQDGNSPFFVEPDTRWALWHEKYLPLKDHNKILEARVSNLSSENQRLSWANEQLSSTNAQANSAIERLGEEKTQICANVAQLVLENQQLRDENSRLSSVITSMKKKNKDCKSCFKNRPADEFPRTDHLAEHEICMDCSAKWVKIKIISDGMTEIPCPDDSCKDVLEYQEIQQHTDKRTFAQFDKLLTQRAIEADPKFRWCSNPKACSGGQLVANGDYVPFYNCIMCGYYSCFNCRAAAHKGLSCAQFRQFLVRGEHLKEENASTKYLEKYTRACYSCGRHCQKIDGCDHITCPSGQGGCGAEWCWLCGAKYPDIRREGNSAHAVQCPHHA